MKAGIFFVIGIWIVFTDNIDFSQGVFLLHGPERSSQAAVMFSACIAFSILTTLLLPKKTCLRLYIWLSLLAAMHHEVWFAMGQSIVGNQIPTQVFWEHFQEFCTQYRKGFGISNILWFFFDWLLFFLQFFFFSVITSKLRIVYRAMIEEIRQGK